MKDKIYILLGIILLNVLVPLFIWLAQNFTIDLFVQKYWINYFIAVIGLIVLSKNLYNLRKYEN